jgi:hypothetical protein
VKAKEKKKSKRGGYRPNTGRPPGAPNKSTKEIKELTRDVVDFKELLEVFKREATKGPKDFNHVSYLCGVKLLEYGFGRPPQQVTVKGDAKNSYTITFGNGEHESDQDS